MESLNHEIIYGAAFTVVGVAGSVYDFRTRQIPNWLVFPAMPAALIAHGVLEGVQGIVSSMLAALVVLVILLPMILKNGMGMGDLKLMLAVGMFAGMEKVLWVMCFTVTINLVLKIIIAKRMRYLGGAVRDSFTMLFDVFRRPFRPHPTLNLDNKDVYKFPFGIAVGLGCILTVVVTAIYSGVIG
jgi:prepilin peptidase CpaA